METKRSTEGRDWVGPSLSDDGYRFEISDSDEHPEWDAFVASLPDGSHLQTSLWGRLKASEGWAAVRLLIRRQGRIIAGAQTLSRPLPLRSRIAYVPKGPLCQPENHELQMVMVEQLMHFAKQLRIRNLSVQPPNHGARLEPDLLAVGYRPSPVAVAPVATVQIDLRPGLDEILARMRGNHRRYIRHGLRQGVVGRIGDESDLRPFYELVVATAQRQGFSPYSFDHFAELWRLFHRHGLAQLFLAEYRGRIISGQMAISFGDRVIAKNSGWTGEFGSVGPNYVMEWTTLRWAKDNGYRYYDLEGIDIDAARAIQEGRSIPENLRKSHSFYKLGFGGEVVVFPQAYTFIPNRVLRWSYLSLLSALSMRYVEPVVDRFRKQSRGGREGAVIARRA